MDEGSKYTEKNKRIEDYIRKVSAEFNLKYGRKIIDEEKIQRVIEIFRNSPLSYEEIVKKIDGLAEQVISSYLQEVGKRYSSLAVKKNHKEIYDKLEVLIKKLNEKGIDYQLGGSLCAYIKYGIESNRTHDDIDINLNEKDIDKFREVCEELGLNFHDNRLNSPRVLKNGIPSGEHEVIATEDESDFHIGVFCFERKLDGSVVSKGYYHDKNGNIYSRNVTFDKDLAQEIFGRERVNFRGETLVITPPEYIYYLKTFTNKDKDLTDIRFMDDKIDKDKLKRIEDLFKHINVEHVMVKKIVRVLHLGSVLSKMKKLINQKLWQRVIKIILFLKVELLVKKLLYLV